MTVGWVVHVEGERLVAVAAIKHDETKGTFTLARLGTVFLRR